MVNLEYKDTDEQREIVNDYYAFLTEISITYEHEPKTKSVKSAMSTKTRGSLDAYCKTYLQGIDGVTIDSFKDVVTAPPDNLYKIKEHLSNLSETQKKESLDYLNNLGYTNKTTNPKSYVERIYNTLSGDRKKAKIHLLQNLNIKICPYCNRNYIYSCEDIHTCQLDHFFPKSKYPILALSYYNFIPSCLSCNNKKREEEFEYYPYIMGKKTDELCHFDVIIKNPEFLKSEQNIGIEMTTDKNYQSQATLLGLPSVYKKHTDVALNILRKKVIFSDEYLDTLSFEFEELHLDKKEMKELIYGIDLDHDSYGKKPLSKFTKDILDAD